MENQEMQRDFDLGAVLDQKVKIKLVYTNRIKLLLCTIFIMIIFTIILLKSL